MPSLRHMIGLHLILFRTNQFTAAARIQSLAQKLLYAAGMAIKKKKNQVPISIYLYNAFPSSVESLSPTPQSQDKQKLQQFVSSPLLPPLMVLLPKSQRKQKQPEKNILKLLSPEYTYPIVCAVGLSILLSSQCIPV